jgi:hypothetical protein
MNSSTRADRSAASLRRWAAQSSAQEVIPPRRLVVGRKCIVTAFDSPVTFHLVQGVCFPVNTWRSSLSRTRFPSFSKKPFETRGDWDSPQLQLSKLLSLSPARTPSENRERSGGTRRALVAGLQGLPTAPPRPGRNASSKRKPESAATRGLASTLSCYKADNMNGYILPG